MVLSYSLACPGGGRWICGPLSSQRRAHFSVRLRKCRGIGGMVGGREEEEARALT